MTNETEPFFSSTGNLGVSRRQDERLYVNAREASTDSTVFAANLWRFIAVGERHSEHIGRTIFRGVVSEEVMKKIVMNQSQHSLLEAALPLRQFTGDNSWLVYLANNHPNRTSLRPVEEMMASVHENDPRSFIDENRVATLKEKGFIFASTFTQADEEQVLSIWSHTFGWGEQEVRNLRARLEVNRQRKPHQRDVWFSSVRNGSEIVSLAMAERLSIPGIDGRTIHLVESTEWKTKSSYQNKGLMTGALQILNAQIIADFIGHPDGFPLIYAECNYHTRSDWAAEGAGFTVPSRLLMGRPTPQVLVQNVRIGDSESDTSRQLRDFTFMYLPAERIQRTYSPEKIREMLSHLER